MKLKPSYNSTFAFLLGLLLVAFFASAGSAQATLLFVRSGANMGSHIYQVSGSGASVPTNAPLLTTSTKNILYGPVVHPSGTTFWALTPAYGYPWNGPTSNTQLQIQSWSTANGALVASGNVVVAGYPGGPGISYSNPHSYIASEIYLFEIQANNEPLLVFPNYVTGNVDLAKLPVPSAINSNLTLVNVMNLGAIDATNNPVRWLAYHRNSGWLFYIRENSVTGISTLYGANTSTSSISTLASFPTGLSVKRFGIDPGSGFLTVSLLATNGFETVYAYFPAPLFGGEYVATLTTSTHLIAGYNPASANPFGDFVSKSIPHFLGTSLFLPYRLPTSGSDFTIDEHTFSFSASGTLVDSLYTHPINLPLPPAPNNPYYFVGGILRYALAAY